MAWALAGVLALACAALAAALVLDDDEPRKELAAAEVESTALEPGGRVVGFPVGVGDAPSAVSVGPADGLGPPRGEWDCGHSRPAAQRNGRWADPRRGPAALSGDRRRSLWVSNFDAHTVTRVGVASHSVEGRIRVGRSPWGLAVAPGSIWVVNHDDDSIQQISTATSRLVGGPIKVGEGPVNASFGYGSIWVTNSQDDTVSRLDLRARVVGEAIPVGDHPEGLSVGAGGVWVANLEDDTVSRIDPASNRVVATIRVGNRPRHLRATGAEVWVPNSDDGTLTLIDSNTNRVVGAPVQIGRSVERVGAGFDAIWATSTAEDTITRVEPTPR